MDSSLDIAGILSALSSNPALMGTLTELLKGTSPKSEQQPESIPSVIDSTQFTASSSQQSPANGAHQGGNGISPELIGTLLSAFGQSAANEARSSESTNQYESNSSQVSLNKLLGGKTDCENRTRLLNALRPYLGEERRSKLDVILKLLKIAELGKLSGILSSV